LVSGWAHSARNNGKRDLLEEVHANEVQQEAQKIRRLQIMISMVMSVIGQDPNLTIEEFAYDILYKPRLQRLMRERFHLQ
jgi:hypothetical protein